MPIRVKLKFEMAGIVFTGECSDTESTEFMAIASRCISFPYSPHMEQSVR